MNTSATAVTTTSDTRAPNHNPAGRMDSLTGLRFLAALAVFGLHVNYSGLRWAFNQGSIGVTFFFILSGTVLAWSWQPTDKARHFYRRRAARIYPAYFVAMLGGLIIEHKAVAARPLAALPSPFLLQAWIPDVHTYFAMNGVSWSLSVEAFFYATFPLIMPFVARLDTRGRRTLQAACVAVLLAVGIFEQITVPGHTGGWQDWFTYICPLPRLFEFVIGMTLVADIRARSLANVPRSAIYVLVAAAYFGAEPLVPGLGDSFLPVIPLALLILRVAQADIGGEPSPFRHRWLIRLGEASYCFYLVHQLVIKVALHGITPDSPAKAAAFIAVTLPVALAAAWLLHIIIERPVDRRLRGPGRPEILVDGAPRTA